jgi:formiminoglutamase
MEARDLFARTLRPAADLFYSRGDAEDVRMGEKVRSDPADYPSAQVVLLGCPQDEGVRRNRGRVGAAQAPAEIRRCLYRLGCAGLDGMEIFDLGDTAIQGTLDDTHALHREIVSRMLADGKRLVIMGGGNDISYPDCGALAQAAAKPLAFNVDAHLDVRADAARNSGTPYRQLLDEGLLSPRRFFEIGAQKFAVSESHAAYLRKLGVRVVALEEARARGVDQVVQEILRESDADAIFWGFDLDAVRSSDAPGVSAPSPLGFSAEELCALAALAGSEARTRVLEFTEVNPVYDVDHRTCRLAAVAIWSALASMAGGGSR